MSSNNSNKKTNGNSGTSTIGSNATIVGEAVLEPSDNVSETQDGLKTQEGLKKPNIDFIEREFGHDPYMNTAEGKAALMAGIALGAMAWGETKWSMREDRVREKKSDDKHAVRQVDAPLFKQIQSSMGHLSNREVRRQLSRVQMLLEAYESKYWYYISSICTLACELNAKSSWPNDLGVNGNFYFSLGFMNARTFMFDRIFPKAEPDVIR